MWSWTKQAEGTGRILSDQYRAHHIINKASLVALLMFLGIKTETHLNTHARDGGPICDPSVTSGNTIS